MYGKIFKSLFDGSMRGQTDLIIVFVWMICHATKDGTVDVVPDKISDDTGLDIKLTLDAILKLEETDPESRTPVEQGRRIKRISEARTWGWQIINYKQYRDIANRESMRELERNRKAEYRSKKSNVPDVSGTGAGQHASTSDSASDLNSSLKGLVIPESLNTHEFMEAWENWIQHRKEIKKPLTRKSAEMQMKRFIGWGVSESIKAIEYTIEKGWQGIRQPDNKQEKRNDTDRRRSEKASREFPEHIEIPTL